MKKIALTAFVYCLSFSVSLAADFMINIAGFSYSPSSIVVQVGDKVTIQASGMHPFIQLSKVNWDNNNPVELAGGLARNTSTFTFTVTAAMLGTIYFGCENHLASSSMKGSINVTSTLPLKITAFNAKKTGGIIQFSWKTETEINALRFEIEKSSNGLNFKSIGSINAHGNSNNTTIYTFNDNTTEFTTNFYRLKLIDISGDFSYSDVVRVSKSGSKKTITITPNPVKNILTIYTDSEVQTEVSIYNAEGKIFLRKSFNNSTNINTSIWESGVYFAKSKIDNKIISKSFIINHL